MLGQVTLSEPSKQVPDLTWEQAVQWLRQQPERESLIHACYYDDPLSAAAQRFAESDEWRAVCAFLPRAPGRALDLGAGRGIGSYALARHGWQVVALEPDPSPVVGAEAIRSLVRETGLAVQVIEDYGEELPFEDSSFDLFYGRAALHHARDLERTCQEAARVLRPGGRFIATREHVISTEDDLETFLDRHDLQWLYGGESAYLLDQYISAIAGSGLHVAKVLGPYDSMINFAPGSCEQWLAACRKPVYPLIGHRGTRLLTNQWHAVGRWLTRRLASRLSRLDGTPGRLYSFVADKRC